MSFLIIFVPRQIIFLSDVRFAAFYNINLSFDSYLSVLLPAAHFFLVHLVEILEIMYSIRNRKEEEPRPSQS